MIFSLSWSHPGRKESQFSVIPIIGQPHLGSYKEYLAIEDDDPAIVNYILVYDWHSNIADDALRFRRS